MLLLAESRRTTYSSAPVNPQTCGAHSKENKKSGVGMEGGNRPSVNWGEF